MKQLDGTGLKRLHREWRRRTTARLALVLDSVHSPFNVGSIVRTAAAYRVEHIWSCGATAPLDASGVRKTAMGTERYLTIDVVENVAAAITAARDDGFLVIGLELAGDARPLHELTLHDTCLVVGHEDHGLSAATLERCDEVAYVPLVGKVGSLNVAVATATALYEARRQEWTRESTGDAT